MIDLTHCPACQAELYRGKDDLSSYSTCNCPFDYILRYKKDLVSPNYVQFKFPKFFATIYFDTDPGWPRHEIMIYSRAEMDREGEASPVVRTKGFDPDFSDLKKLENRISIMVTFS